MPDLVRQALAVNEALFALGNEVFHAEGATFVRNRVYPAIRDANHVAHVRASTPDAIDRLFDRVEREFAGYPHRAFQLDLDTPPEFGARLALDGYAHDDALVMLLEGDLRGGAPPVDIRPVEDDAAWAEYETLNIADWSEFRNRLEVPEAHDVGRALFETRRAKSPPARYWLAYVDGAPAGYLLSWEGTEGVGQVEDLFTHRDYRHRGLATALIHHCVADARAHAAGPVVIVADPTDTPMRMYAAMGFRPVAVKRAYRKEGETPNSP